MATSTEAVPQPNTQATTTPVTSVLTVVYLYLRCDTCEGTVTLAPFLIQTWCHTGRRPCPPALIMGCSLGYCQTTQYSPDHDMADLQQPQTCFGFSLVTSGS